MEHLSITFPQDLRQALDHEADKEHTKRSTLIQKAVRIYLKLKRQSEIDHLLREGYQEMAATSGELMRDFRAADDEAARHAD